MKKYIFLFISVSCLLFACSKKNDTSSNNAMVMFVNGCIPASSIPFSVDGYINTSSVSGATNIALLKNSSYKNVPQGTDSVSFAVTGNPIGGIKSTTLTTGNHYTAFLGGSSYSNCFIFTTDDLTVPPSGFSKVRFVNLCTDNLNLNCFIGSTKVDSNVGYSTATTFFQIAASTSAVLMQDPLFPTKMASPISPAPVFASGKIYTIMLTGSSVNTGNTGLTYTIIANN